MGAFEKSKNWKELSQNIQYILSASQISPRKEFHSAQIS